MLKILFFLCLFCPKTCIPARPPPRFAAQLPCSVGVLFQYMLCRRAKRTGMGCSHPTSNFTTLCKKKTASAFLHADGSGGDGGFSRALKTAHRAVFARRDAKRRARAVLIPPATSLHRAKRKPPAFFFTLTASGGDGGFSRALKTAHWAVFARRDAKRRARAVLIPPATSLHCAKRKPPALFFTLTALAEMVGFEPTCPVKDKTISSL